MKIMWLNPWFGNYRLPVYESLNNLTGGNFFLMSGTQEMDPQLIENLKTVLRGNCIINTSYKRIYIGNTKTNFANSCINIPITRGVIRGIRHFSPDILIVDGFFQWAPFALLYSLIFRVPLVIDYERTEYVERSSPWWRTFYRKIFGKFVSGFVVNGTLTTNYLKTLCLDRVPIQEGCMAADTYGLSLKVRDFDSNIKAEFRSKYILDDGILFLFVGQMVERKGVIQMLKAWKSHSQLYPNDRLLIIGIGELDYLIKDDVNTIIYEGKVEYSDIYKYYSIADVFLMPTLEDNWSLVVPEAMACHLPILTSIYNGCYPELVRNKENGYYFDPLNHDEFVHLLSQMHDEDLTKMGEESYKIQLDYTPDKSAERIYRLCEKVLCGSK